MIRLNPGVNTRNNRGSKVKMRKAPYPDFELAEYKRRYERTKKLMDKYDIDALLLSTEANVRYLTGLLSGYWIATRGDDMQLVLITRNSADDCVLLLPDHMASAANNSSWVEDLRHWSQFGSGKIITKEDVVVDTIKEKESSNSRIGMEIGPDSRLGMSLPCYYKIREKLSSYKFVDCSGLMEEVRMIKSENEISCIRKACEISCKGFEAGFKSLKEGMSEKELVHTICSTMVKESDEVGITNQWIIFISGGKGRESCFDSILSDYRFRKGDIIIVDGGFIYRGYGADFFRTVSFGKPSHTALRLFEANRQANLAGIKAVRDGVKGSDVAKVVIDKWIEMGCKKEVDEQIIENDYDFIGHGVGLQLHESPIISSKDETILKEGMVLSFEGMLVDKMPFSQTKIAIGIEENFRVTKDGYEIFTSLDNNLWIV